MPNITRIVGMHNSTPEANRDAVWAGVVLRHDNGTYQFVALNGRRLGALRETGQPATTSGRANDKFDQMYREKLAHGYSVIDWTMYRYGLQGAIVRLGNINQGESIMPAAPGQGDAPHPQTVPRTRVRPTDDPAPVTVPEPSVEALLQYISGKTDSLTPDVEKPDAGVAKPEEPQRWIRRARRPI